MLGEDIQFIYHTGTGNTLLIVKEMIKTFEENGKNVKTYKIESTKSEDIDPNITIGLALPVAFQSTFPFIWKFINDLPKSHGTSIFMVDTLAIYSGAIVGPLKKILTKKGYTCIGAEEIVMPNNFLRTKTNTKKDKEKISQGIKKARIYAETLLSNNAHWGRIPFFSDLFRFFCCNTIIMNHINLSYGKKLSVNKQKCSHCGLCETLCPLGNINMKDYPQFGNTCELCMRCLNFCPKKAIIIPKKTFLQYNIVKVNDILSKKNSY
jgi:ferredoxin